MKEWHVIKQTYPASAQNLNRLTKTIDIDIYDENSEKVKIDEMPEEWPIKVKTKRMIEKDKYYGVLVMPETVTVNVAQKLTLIKVIIVDVLIY